MVILVSVMIDETKIRVGIVIRWRINDVSKFVSWIPILEEENTLHRTILEIGTQQVKTTSFGFIHFNFIFT